MNRKVSKIAKPIALIGIGLSLLSGCSRAHEQPVLAILAFDVSGSAESKALDYARAVYASQRALPPGSELKAYVFGHGCELVYTGGKITGRDEFNQKVGEALASPSQILRNPGTQTDRLLETVAADAKAAARPVAVLIATDGGMEDQSEVAMRRLRSSLKALAACSDVKVVALLGVLPGYRRQWEEWLAPLGPRAIVRGDRDWSLSTMSELRREVRP